MERPIAHLARPLPRVLWVTGNFRPEVGGLQVYIDRLLAALAPYCHLALVTESWQDGPSDLSVRHFRVHGIGRPTNSTAWARSGREIAACARTHSAHIVHFANANVAVYRSVIANALPVFATVHGNDLTAPWQFTPGRDPQICIVEALNACARVVAVSGHTASLIRQCGVRSPITVMHHGCDTEFFRPSAEEGRAMRRRYGIDDLCPLLLTVARLVDRKGHATVIEALRHMPFRPHWLVVGDGPIRECLHRRIASNGLADQVTLTGQISDDELRGLYNACDFFVFVPGERSLAGRLDSEGFGLVLLEAAACGKPIIASDIAGCRDAVAHGETALLVPPDDPPALVEAISPLLSRPNVATALASRALAAVREAGGWSRVARELAQLYSVVLIDAWSERILMEQYRV
jgi:phosphatidylinositol alpha-1,6-mannosyltransferase